MQASRNSKKSRPRDEQAAAQAAAVAYFAALSKSVQQQKQSLVGPKKVHKSHELELQQEVTIMDQPPALRKSIFPGVPPFINYVPMGGFSGEVLKGPQYWDEDKWDQDQLWRFTLAINRWIDQCEESQRKSAVANWEVSNKCAEMSNKRIGVLSRKQVTLESYSNRGGIPSRYSLTSFFPQTKFLEIHIFKFLVRIPRVKGLTTKFKDFS